MKIFVPCFEEFVNYFNLSYGRDSGVKHVELHKNPVDLSSLPGGTRVVVDIATGELYATDSNNVLHDDIIDAVRANGMGSGRYVEMLRLMSTNIFTLSDHSSLDTGVVKVARRMNPELVFWSKVVDGEALYEFDDDSDGTDAHALSTLRKYGLDIGSRDSGRLPGYERYEYICPYYVREFIDNRYASDLVRACLNGKWGLLDSLGNVRVPFEYDEIGSVDNETGLAEYARGGSAGYMDVNGEVVDDK